MELAGDAASWGLGGHRPLSGLRARAPGRLQHQRAVCQRGAASIRHARAAQLAGRWAPVAAAVRGDGCWCWRGVVLAWCDCADNRWRHLLPERAELVVVTWQLLHDRHTHACKHASRANSCSRRLASPSDDCQQPCININNQRHHARAASLLRLLLGAQQVLCVGRDLSGRRMQRLRQRRQPRAEVASSQASSARAVIHAGLRVQQQQQHESSRGARQVLPLACMQTTCMLARWHACARACTAPPRTCSFS